LVVYVNDIVITGDDVKEFKSLKGRLGRAFEIKKTLDFFDTSLGSRLLGHQRALFYPKGNMSLIY
jgi:hypothetical protein